MKTSLKLLTFLTLIAICCSLQCKKDISDTTTVSGTVTETATGKGIPNATIILNRSKPGPLTGGGNAPYEYYHADANGNYSFTFKQVSGYSYDVNPDMPLNKYWAASSNHGPYLNVGESNIRNLKLDAKGYVRIHYKSVNTAVYNTIFRKARKRIETLFSQLCDQFMIRRNYAKSFMGFKTRILSKITALTTIQYLNKFVFNRNLNNIKVNLFL
jgi:hypothetical protein